jgi:hypothetical protein
MMLLPPWVSAKSERCTALVELHELLQTARFAEFWSSGKRQMFSSSVIGFDAAIRRYVLGCLALTYREMPAQHLCKSLGFVDLAALQQQQPHLKIDNNKVVLLESPSTTTATGASNSTTTTNPELQLAQLTDLILTLEKKNDVPLL